mmetsp:Transcript_86763/g.166977  ORF Transcript_86763/g.166977 Transcript_86763/m.166977 type:complete len:366 (-) Transcript_86763:148-1245(-)
MGAGCCSHDEAAAATLNDKAQLEVARESEADSLQVRDVEVLKMMDPELPKPKLTITIVDAKGIRNSDWLPGLGKPDCYCCVLKGGTEIFKTKTINNSLMPLWEERFEIFDDTDIEELEFKVWDKDFIGSDYLGKVVVKKEAFAENGINGEFEMEEAGGNIRAYLGLKIEVAGKECPPSSAVDIEVTVERGDDMKYGIRIDDQSKLDLQIYEIEEGAFQKYNESVEPDLQVTKSDYIVSVNGIEDNCEEMMQQFNTPKVTVKFKRALNFTVILDKSDTTKKLGIIVPKPMRNDCLAIMKIEDGLIKDYNDKCAQESDQILERDRIVSVKGRTGSAGHLKTKMDSMKGKFQVGMQRPHPGHLKSVPR